MRPPQPARRLNVNADLAISVTSPDGDHSEIRVTDRDGELLVDVDRPIAVLRSMPAPADLRAVARLASGAPAAPASHHTLPVVRLRSRGVTMVVLGAGRPRPGWPVAGAAIAVATVTAVLVALVARAIRHSLSVRHNQSDRA